MKLPKIKPAELPGDGAKWVDNRLAVASPVRKLVNKVFPDHWSFMLGEIALYAFIILLITGTFLTLFFEPSMREVVYDGAYTPMRGLHMSQAYKTTLDISFEVRGGLIMRQIHHWSALLFVAAMMVHMFRIFFTGAFRRPREINWLIGFNLFLIGFVEGFLGYGLPDDALSGTGLRITGGIIQSVPIVGSWLSFAIFGGEFPGELIVSRMYILHVFLLPLILLGLIATHIGIVVKQKHTQFPGPGRTEHNVVGTRFLPAFSGKAAGFSMVVFGVLAGLGGLVQINPIWIMGPYKSAVVSAGSQPDFYMGWTDGLVRLFPAWETRLFDHTIPAAFYAAAIPGGILVTLAMLYPFIERFLITKDGTHHNLLDRPRDAPTRTALGAMAITFYLVLLISGGNDIIAEKFHISLNAMTWAGRIGLLLLPPIAFYLTYRICLGLQQHDREVLAHGVETGIIKRLPSGAFIEVHQPLAEPDEHGHTELPYTGAAVPKKMNKLSAGGHAIRGFFAPVEQPSPTPIAPKEEAEKELAGASAIDTGHSGSRV